MSPPPKFLVWTSIPVIFGVLGAGYEFVSCKYDILSIQNGTKSIGDITNETIGSGGWLWPGEIPGLNENFNGSKLTAVTYKGCVEICGNKTELNKPNVALGIIATWVFPLAILFSLPYESLHDRKFRGTVTAIANWLGSPQTAMTATIFNLDQTRNCHRQTRGRNGRAWDDAYYVLSCFNQFELPLAEMDVVFLRTFIYGLFRPLHAGRGRQENNQDIEYTEQLLAALATHLRLLRRRGAIPMLLSLGTFLLAFIFSVVLAFADIGENIDVTPLTLGLLWAWLPLLVILTIVDRNPVSSERTAELMTRWLYNVNRVRHWGGGGGGDSQPSGWWNPATADTEHFFVGEFIGQGRDMTYCGLVHATIQVINDPARIGDDITEYDIRSDAVAASLRGHKPWAWWWSALRALLLVWIQVMMAFVVAITSPPVGIGCWSGGVFLFGVLSSITFIVRLFGTLGPRIRLACLVSNLIALAFLIFVTFLVLTGAMNNCYCNTISGGYMIFENFDFIRGHFDVVGPWAVASVVGGVTASVVLFRAITCWIQCQHLWSTRKGAQGLHGLQPLVHANMDWLL